MSSTLEKKNYDVQIIGGGHNGLIAAAYLARAGYQVLVLERKGNLGGVAVTEEVFPGFHADIGANDAGHFPLRFVEEFGLRKHGLQFIDSPVLVFSPQLDGSAFTLWRGERRIPSDLTSFSQNDVEQYERFRNFLLPFVEILREIFMLSPPKIPDIDRQDIISWIKFYLKARGYGNRIILELLHILPMPLVDFLNEWFESEILKGVIGCKPLSGVMQGPYAPGTTVLFLYKAIASSDLIAGGCRLVRGGMSRLISALEKEIRSLGATIQTNSKAERIQIEDGRATGVILEDGTYIRSKVILSNADPRTTFFDLVGTEHLDVKVVREVKNIRYRGCVTRVILALTDLPRFSSALQRASDEKEGTLLSGRVVICPSLDYLERAYDDAKYGRISNEPYLEISIPTILNPSLAPKGQHLMVVNVQYTPYHLKDINWEQGSHIVREKVIAILESYAPGITNLITYEKIITPRDYEHDYYLPEGDPSHGQMALDQLIFMRPFPGASGYRTPIKGLYLCGSGSHPGGGVTGIPGYNCARTVVSDLSKVSGRSE